MLTRPALNSEDRRRYRNEGEDRTLEALVLLHTQSGSEALESYADGVIAAVGRSLAAAISPDFAMRAFEDAAARLRARSGGAS